MDGEPLYPSSPESLLRAAWQLVQQDRPLTLVGCLPGGRKEVAGKLAEEHDRRAPHIQQSRRRRADR